MGETHVFVIIFKRGGKKKFVAKKEFGHWKIGEVGFWGPKTIGKSKTEDGIMDVIKLKYGEIKRVDVVK